MDKTSPAKEDVGERIRIALSRVPEAATLTETSRYDWLSVQLGGTPSRNTVMRWAKGQSDIGYRDMVRVAEALNMPLDYFAGIDTNPSADQLNEHLRRLLRAHKQRLAEAQDAISGAASDVDALLAGL